MSKNSTKQRVTQLMEWMTTLKSKRKKPVRSSGMRQRSGNDVRIKNGPNGRR